MGRVHVAARAHERVESSRRLGPSCRVGAWPVRGKLKGEGGGTRTGQAVGAHRQKARWVCQRQRARRRGGGADSQCCAVSAACACKKVSICSLRPRFGRSCRFDSGRLVIGEVWCVSNQRSIAVRS